MRSSKRRVEVAVWARRAEAGGCTGGIQRKRSTGLAEVLSERPRDSGDAIGAFSFRSGDQRRGVSAALVWIGVAEGDGVAESSRSLRARTFPRQSADGRLGANGTRCRTRRLFAGALLITPTARTARERSRRRSIWESLGEVRKLSTEAHVQRCGIESAAPLSAADLVNTFEPTMGRIASAARISR